MGSNSKNILIIGSSSSPHVISRITGFIERGYNFAILTDKITGISDIQEISLYPTYYQADFSSLKSKLKYKINRFKELGSIYRKLKTFDPKIIHFHYASNRLGILFALVLRKPIVVSVMGGDILFDERNVKKIDRLFVRILLKRADEITTKSDFLRSKVLKLGDYGKKTIKVIWGVDTNYFRPMDSNHARENLNIPVNARILFCPKSLKPLYNIHLIIQAVSMIRDEFPDIQLLLTDFHSNPEYKKYILEQIGRLSMEKQVKIAKKIDHKEIIYYYNAADVIIGIPSYDGLPQSLLESMACGKPHILGDLDRYREIVEDGESAIFTGFSPQNIAQAIRELLLNDSLRKKIGQNSREIVKKEADFEESLNIVEELYSKYQ